MKLLKSSAIIFVLHIFIATQHARSETLGLIPAQVDASLNGSTHAMELGYYTAENFSHFGLRYYRRLGGEQTLYVDIGQSDVDIEGLLASGATTPGDMTPFGVGYLRQIELPGVKKPVTLRVSYHQATLKNSDPLINVTSGAALELKSDVYELSADLLYSGTIANLAGGLDWYASLGYHRFSREISIDGTGNGLVTEKRAENESAYGIGFSRVVGSGVAYIGAEYVDEVNWGAGFRILFNSTSSR